MIKSHHIAVMYSQYRPIGQFPLVFGPGVLVHLHGNAQHRFTRLVQPRLGKLGEFSGTLNNSVLIIWAGMLIIFADENEPGTRVLHRCRAFINRHGPHQAKATSESSNFFS